MRRQALKHESSGTSRSASSSSLSLTSSSFCRLLLSLSSAYAACSCVAWVKETVLLWGAADGWPAAGGWPRVPHLNVKVALLRQAAGILQAPRTAGEGDGAMHSCPTQFSHHRPHSRPYLIWVQLYSQPFVCLSDFRERSPTRDAKHSVLINFLLAAQDVRARSQKQDIRQHEPHAGGATARWVRNTILLICRVGTQLQTASVRALGTAHSSSRIACVEDILTVWWRWLASECRR